MFAWIRVPPAVCRGKAATHSHPSPGTIQSGRGRYQWSSGTKPHSRRNPAHTWPGKKQTTVCLHNPLRANIDVFSHAVALVVSRAHTSNQCQLTTMN